MKLASHTMLFDFYGIPILESRTTGDIIGLTAEGAGLCQVMLEHDVDRSRIDAVDPMLFDAFAKGRFLDGTDDSPEETRSFVSAYVHVTQRCNLSCVGCYSFGSERNRLPDAPRAKLRIAFETLSALGAKHATFSGGEPFLRSDLGDLCRDANEAGIEQLTVLTNGLLVDANTMRSIAPYVERVVVSFDGASTEDTAFIRGEQRFDELVKAVRTVQDAGAHAHIVATVHGRNYHNLHEYVHLAQQLGATLNFSILSCMKSSEDTASLLFDDSALEEIGVYAFENGKRGCSSVMDAPMGLNLSLNLGCGAGKRMLSVAADGTVYPCHLLHHHGLRLGNAFVDSPDEIAKAALNLSEGLLQSKLPDKCKGCSCAPFCAGGCKARALFEHGTLSAKDPYCPMMKTFYERLGADLTTRYAL